VRISLVVVQAMFRRAQEWGWVISNPAKAVRKPSGVRERAVVCLEPARIEAIRTVMVAQERSWAALMVSLAAYAGLRIPEEVLALEWRHVRERTLLVEQRLIDGEIVPGQKVRHFRPRAVDLLAPLRKALAEYRLLMGWPDGLIFSRRDGEPWRRTDFNNWRRRVWHGAREQADVELLPPYDLRHAFASLQIRAGMPLPELAEQLGHAPQMTLATYAHVMRELKGLPAVSAEAQIQAAPAPRSPQVDHGESSSARAAGRGDDEIPATEGNGEGQNRTGDTTIFSRGSWCTCRARPEAPAEDLPANRIHRIYRDLRSVIA
jgi:integrase